MNVKQFTCPSTTRVHIRYHCQRDTIAIYMYIRRQEMIIIALVFNVILLSPSEGTFITHSHVTYIFLKNYFVDFNSEP